MDSLDSPQPGLEGNHHLPPYSILCVCPQYLHPNGFFVPALPRRSPEIFPIWIPGTLGAHNSQLKPPIGIRSEVNL